MFDQEVRSPDSLLLETATEMGAQRIFVDGIGLFKHVLANSDPIGGEYRELLQQLMESLNRENLTAILALELGATADSVAKAEMADFLADTVIHLQRERHGRRMQRSLEIEKSRGQDFETGEHTLQITSGKGMEVFRRVQAPLRDRD